MISRIQRFSLDDGPGIRTTVFFCGCNLRCTWCHNPECIPFDKKLRYQDALCIGCGLCQAVCPQHVHAFDQKAHLLDRSICSACGLCADSCPTGALSLNGNPMTSEELQSELDKDRVFYEISNGGVTFSGGDPLLQPDFLLDMLKKCRLAGIHTAVDTAGNLPWAVFSSISPFVDLFLYDIKMATPEKHLLATGADNRLILQNIIRLTEQHARVWVRIPLIPALHDEAEIGKMADFLSGLPIERIELLPYHRYGIGKYKELGETYSLDCDEPSAQWLEKVEAAFSRSTAKVVLKN